MTKIKNIGSKIIGVGKVILMPDQTISVADSVAELPAIKTFAKMGFVAIEKEVAKTATKEERVAYSQQISGNSKKKKLLFIAALIDLWFYYSIVLRIKDKKKVVICDRYIWDTYIDFKMKYPEYDFERGFWWRLTLKTMLKPQASFCLFIPAEESMRRSGLKDEPFPEDVQIRQQRIDMYVKELENDRWHHVIDASQSIDDVKKQILERL